MCFKKFLKYEESHEFLWNNPPTAQMSHLGGISRQEWPQQWWGRGDCVLGPPDPSKAGQNSDGEGGGVEDPCGERDLVARESASSQGAGPSACKTLLPPGALGPCEVLRCLQELCHQQLRPKRQQVAMWAVERMWSWCGRVAVRTPWTRAREEERTNVKIGRGEATKGNSGHIYFDPTLCLSLFLLGLPFHSWGSN